MARSINYLERRAQLETEGERLRSDTPKHEVLLRLRPARARRPSNANGMFALALVDTVARTFLLARDRLGSSALLPRSARAGAVRLGAKSAAGLAGGAARARPGRAGQTTWRWAMCRPSAASSRATPN